MRELAACVRAFGIRKGWSTWRAGRQLLDEVKVQAYARRQAPAWRAAHGERPRLPGHRQGKGKS